MIFILILAIMLVIPLGLYMYYYMKRSLEFYGLTFNKRRKIILGIVDLFICLVCVNLFGFPALIVLHIFGISVALDMIRWIICKSIKREIDKSGKMAKIYRSGLVPIIFTLLIVLYGFFNMNHVIETDYTVTTDKKLQQKEYQIALLSDLHFGTTMKSDALKKYVARINKKKVDFVVLDGDIVDERTSKEQMEICFKTLGNIKSKYGTVYVYGNHDRATYSSKADFSKKELKESIERNQIKILQDETWNINQDLVVAGREDNGFRGSNHREKTNKILGKVDKNAYIILLDHQPNGLKENKKAGVNLMLSGHTHGGQIWPVGLISDLLGFGEINYGIKKDGKFECIVTSGMAGWGYPIRTGHHSEYVIVHLKQK